MDAFLQNIEDCAAEYGWSLLAGGFDHQFLERGDAIHHACFKGGFDVHFHYRHYYQIRLLLRQHLTLREPSDGGGVEWVIHSGSQQMTLGAEKDVKSAILRANETWEHIKNRRAWMI